MSQKKLIGIILGVILVAAASVIIITVAKKHALQTSRPGTDKTQTQLDASGYPVGTTIDNSLKNPPPGFPPELILGKPTFDSIEVVQYPDKHQDTTVVYTMKQAFDKVFASYVDSLKQAHWQIISSQNGSKASMLRAITSQGEAYVTVVSSAKGAVITVLYKR